MKIWWAYKKYMYTIIAWIVWLLLILLWGIIAYKAYEKLQIDRKNIEVHYILETWQYTKDHCKIIFDFKELPWVYYIEDFSNYWEFYDICSSKFDYPL